VNKKILPYLDSPKALRALNQKLLPKLANEVRETIVDFVAVKKGHLAASLGVVELTIALHYVFETPNDLLVWDVGHQAYGHKLLTGRFNNFESMRQWQGISGFPSRAESPYDAFGTGHASTSISAVLGMAQASRLNGDESKQHIAVIGDASIAGGMAFEGLNSAGESNSNILIILNDNAIGIDPSVGALKSYFGEIKSAASPKDNFFEALNFHYQGPIDGHDIDSLILHLNKLKQIKGPKVLHINTVKGKGVSWAESDPLTYHAPGKFDKKTGTIDSSQHSSLPPKFQEVFGKTLVELGAKNKKIVGITPAMPSGSSLNFFMDAFPERSFDVGIAEQHAVTFSAGLASQGHIPFCAIYSTFLQRAYDQVIHDVALQNLHVVFCLDRAGLVGEDGATHHGVFDIAFLRSIPNMIVSAPRNEMELRNLMFTAQQKNNGPFSIRYPRGRGRILKWEQPFEYLPIGKGQLLKKGTDVAILSLGTTAETIENALDALKESSRFSHYDLRYAKPLDTDLLHTVFQTYQTVVVIEDGVLSGGVGSAVLEFSNDHQYTVPIKRIGIPDRFIEHGSLEEIRHDASISVSAVQGVLNTL